MLQPNEIYMEEVNKGEELDNRRDTSYANYVFNDKDSFRTDSFNEGLNFVDSREHTSDPIYEAYRRRQLIGKGRQLFVFSISTFLCISAVITICLLQYDEYYAYINQRDDYILKSQGFCKTIGFANIDIISTPISAALILFYIFLYKRRVFLRNKFKYRNVGLPMFVSVWNKTDRLLTGFTYGLIAFNIYNIVRNAINGNKASKGVTIKDPSGLLQLLFKVAQMFLIGIRYYPVLVAQRANTFVINLTCALYMLADFAENIYQYGKCESIYSEADTETFDKSAIDDLTFKLPYFIAYKALSAIPLCLFLSFIVVNLVYKSMVNLFDFVFKYRSYWTRLILKEKAKDTFFCLLLNVDDDDEVFYTKYDLDYVYDLLKVKKSNNDNKNKNADDSDSSFNDLPKRPNFLDKWPPQVVQKYSKKQIVKQSIVKKILNKIYPIDPSFRFTSKFINTMVVAVTTLYYVVLFIAYNFSFQVIFLLDKLPDKIDLSQKLEISVGDLLCGISEDVCIEQLQQIGPLPIPIPKKFQKYFQLYGTFKQSVICIFVIPIFLVFLICLLQLLFLAKDSKTHIKELYKGECEFVVKAKNLSNPSIASASFHFGGYVVGYLVWGYLIMYIAVVILGIAIYILRIFAGDNFFAQLALKLVPVITVIIVKQIVNIIFTRYIFLYRDSNILALKNFRAFNVFLYFNFYFDCFMGIISAVIRLIKAVILAVVMMPRISYSFMGRHFERKDNGYGCYSGFLHMEAMHTNPILITFLSLLYYKDLSEHVRRFKIERKIFKEQEDGNNVLILKRFNGRLSMIGPLDPDIQPNIRFVKFYKKRVVNKWRLILFMSYNKRIVFYRKHYILAKKIEKPIKPSMFSKIKSFITTRCCKQKTTTKSKSNIIKTQF